MKKIYIIYNYWELFISLILLNGENKGNENILIINNEKIDKRVLRKIKNKYKVKEFHFFSNIFIKFLTYYFKLYIYLPLKLKKYKNQEKEILTFSDQEVISRFFIKSKQDLILYEHGIINYENNFTGVIQKVKKIFFGMEKPYGRNKYVKKIFLKFPDKAPDDIKNKVKKLDIDELIGKLNWNSKVEILHIFDIDIKLEKKIIILLTQPLEIKTCSEREKKEIYKKIYNEYSCEYTVYIKPHPLEKTNYKYLTDKILNKNFPIELFLFNNIIPNKIVTLFSSGCFSFIGKCDVDFLGTAKFENIYKKRPIESIFYKKGIIYEK